METTAAYTYPLTDYQPLGTNMEVNDGILPFDASPDTMFTDPFHSTGVPMDFMPQSEPTPYPAMLHLQGQPSYPESKSPLAISPSVTESGNGINSAQSTADSIEPKNVDQPQPQPPKKRGRPRRSRAKSSADTKSSPAKVRKASKTPSRKDSTKQSDDSSDHGSDKSHLRARNRVAAAKFRERKRESVGKLKDKEECARAANRVLADEIAHLKEETLQLKSMVLEHAGCGCGHIDEYIKHAASGLALSASSPAGSVSTALSGSGCIPGSSLGPRSSSGIGFRPSPGCGSASSHAGPSIAYE
ncbi:Transcription factor-like protein [Emericellopsis cladophorae]|uniref:Transcription factor-like protein n=1 Tax=Emericellopsis cladophorae TaxID=2686198 RepID=A0A9Q0BAS0_9HYPO|nr:Transcription factor-like protein [Emericellopsis cladophorae]KAI6778552.1 Transcription factor-like protein [Emericellopsis cladophorae]